ncbi:protein FAM3B [Pseudophryne corroboree]|uniref:protein FAM3B n=1 Tax=Pseudophryne corroboree TaxID=495146 RepID=UPI00308152A9
MRRAARLSPVLLPNSPVSSSRLPALPAMVNYRFLSATSLKVIGLVCASVCAWYMGYLFAEILPEDSLQTAIGSIQQIGARPVIRAPKPVRQKCAVWRTCSSTEIVYRIRSGAGKNVLPEFCMDDKILLGGSLQTGNRGINFVIVNYKTLQVTDTKTFDMYEGDFSGAMVDFISKIPDGSIILVASHDDSSTKLSDAAKKAIEGLGSKEVRNLKFRSQLVFLGIKGGSVPADIEREKIIHSDNSRNRYSGWPAEIQIDGCLPKKLD